MRDTDGRGDSDLYWMSCGWSMALLMLAHSWCRELFGPERGLADRSSGLFNRRRVPALTIDVTVGFLDNRSEVDRFGIRLGVSPEDEFRQLIPLRRVVNQPISLTEFERFFIGRLGPPLSWWEFELGGSWVGAPEPFVVISDRVTTEDHCRPLGFSGGSSASLVRSDKFPGVGELGCAHVISARSTAAELSDGDIAPILAVDRQVDLAVVERACSEPLHVRDLQRWPAPWMPCSLRGNRSSIDTRICDVSNTYGVFGDPALPVHVDLELAGLPGDSGASVIDSTSNRLLGVYCGRIITGGPIDVGRAVHIQHAEKAMRLEFVE